MFLCAYGVTMLCYRCVAMVCASTTIYIINNKRMLISTVMTSSIIVNVNQVIQYNDKQHLIIYLLILLFGI